MNNKKRKVETSTSVSDLVKSKESKIVTSTSVSDLIKSNKSKIKIKSKETKMANLIKLNKRYLYTCHCIRCNGAEVDFRTQEGHTKDKSLWKSEGARKKEKSIVTQDTKKQKRASSPKPDSSQQNSGFDPFNEDIDSSQPNNNHTLFSSSPTSSKPSYFHVPALDENEGGDEYIDRDEDGEDKGNDDNGGDNEDDDGNGDDDGKSEDDDEDSDIEDLFASPELDSDEIFMMANSNDSMEIEIILWAFKFQQRFRLSDIALEVLIKFLHVVLTRLNKSQFKNFPASLYIAKNMLNIFQPKMQLVVCSDCHKLYNTKNIVEYKEEGEVAIMNCSHEEYPNNPIPSRHNKCNNPLTVIKRNKDKTIAIPRMLYSKPSIRQQLSMLYQRPGFENMLKSSGIQREGHNIYSDIYDGRVWKTFSFDSNTFFTTETATTYLGLLIILNGFQ